VLLGVLEVAAIGPALQKCLDEMTLVEKSGGAPSLICDANARGQMAQRLGDFVTDIRSSRSLSSFAKVILVAGAERNLQSHAALLAMAPAATTEKVIAPVFIVSFPRTCTTILHRTMAQDRKRWRNFDLCDMIRPMPPVTRDDAEGRNACAEEVGKELDLMDLLFPGWKKALESMHGFHPGEAEEDLGWYDVGLGHMYMDILMLTYPEQRAKEGGVSPLESKAVAKIRFAWLDLVMRIYQSVETKGGHNEKGGNHDERPWLMKDPNHAAYLPELLAQFPDAKLIFTHRPPKVSQRIKY
jgi:hypothetical protein